MMVTKSAGIFLLGFWTGHAALWATCDYQPRSWRPHCVVTLVCLLLAGADCLARRLERA